MDSEEFVSNGHRALDFIAQYYSTLSERPVSSDVEPGYLRKILPTEAPQEGEPFEIMLSDVEKHIFPGLTHWQSGSFFSYYPANTSAPSVLAELLVSAINPIGISWASSPAVTELEAVTMDWLGKMIGLPERFLFYDKDGEKTGGGGVIESSGSESTQFALLAARTRAIGRLREEQPGHDDYFFMSKLIAYTSDEAHFSVDRACSIGAVKLRIVPSDDFGRMRGPALDSLLKEDVRNGLVPFFICATLGTTSTCAFDCLEEVGPLAKQHGAWLHIDAAYAGSSFVCPEYRHWMKGVEFSDSFNFNPHKNLAMAFHCSALWVASQKEFTAAFGYKDPPYLSPGQLCPELHADYRYFQIALGRRFESLKMWFVMRSYGVVGLQRIVKERCSHADRFADHVRSSDLFELLEGALPHLGLVCFRMKGCNELTMEFVKQLNTTRQVSMQPTQFKGKAVVRFSCGSLQTDSTIVDRAWKTVEDCGQKLAADKVRI